MAYSLPKVEEQVILFCKTFAHAWDEIPNVPQPPKTIFTVTVYLRCIHCTTERHDHINVLGDIAAREYMYPENYRDAPKAEKADLRVRYLYGRPEWKSLTRRSKNAGR